MSIEKMREEFEAWARSQNWVPERDSFGDYVYGTVRAGWEAWQASRAALVIELPQQSGVNRDWNQAIRYCHQAIEAAGVGVKP